MKTWYISANALPQWRLGSVTVVEAPWYVHFAEWLVDSGFLSCAYIPAIPFPDIWKRVWDKNDPEFSTQTLKEWYGSLDQWWHCRVCIPITEWAWNHPKRKQWHVDLGYSKLKEVFYLYDKDYFDEQEEIVEIDREEDNEKA